MRSYRHRTWDLIESFDAFNIQKIPRKTNAFVDRMATIGSHFDPVVDLLVNPQAISVIIRPAIPDNDTHWQVFKSDEKTTLFIQNSREFADQLQPKVKEAYEDQIIQLKSNKLPNGLITLENLFDCDDARNDKRNLMADKGDYIDMSLGNGRILNVRKEVPPEDRERLARYCDEYMGLLAWSYEYLKGYNSSII